MSKADDFIQNAAEYQDAAKKLQAKREALQRTFTEDEFSSVLDAMFGAQPMPSNRSFFDFLSKAGSAVLAFTQSGTFYFFTGLILLLYSAHMQQQLNASVHPSILFLLAILGVAILLFGTGSQSAGAIATSGAPLPNSNNVTAGGTGAADLAGIALPADHPVTLAVDKVKEVEAAIAAANAKPSEAEKIQSFAGLAGPAGDAVKASENARAAAIASIGSVTKSPGDWGPVKANAAVAGGAAVLAALFGWGIIHYSPGIKQVFSLEDHYERVFISACAAYKAVCSLDELPKDSALSEFTLSDYDISIYMDSGTPIPFIREDRRIRLVLLSEDTRNSSFFWLKIKRSKNGEGTEFRKELTLPVKLGTKERGSSNCASFEGTSGQSCPLAALSLEGQVANEDRARVKVYSLNFFGERDQTGLVKTQAKVLPDEKGGLKSGVGAIPLDFDLSVKSGSAAQ